MKQKPASLGIIHFVGIGGIGMSGIAEVLHNLGYQVRGSDLNDNANVKRLRALGIACAVGHNAANIDGASVLVISSAVKPSNPEYAAAKARHIPIVRRAEMLAELMRLKTAIGVAGTHGKTTTTSLISTLLYTAGLDPTVINGGIINAFGTNSRLGQSEWLVAETDESDGSFIRLPLTIGIITNIDPEHMEHYGDFDTVRAAYLQFIQNIPFYGFAAVCIDHPEVQNLIAKVEDRRILTYGTSPQADARAVNITIDQDGCRFDVEFSPLVKGTTRSIKNIFLPMFGHHNVLNATASLLVGTELGITGDTLRDALAGFEGVKRRFTKTGSANGVTIIDDYGHHPVEIKAVLQAARQVAGTGKVIAVMQPHRYSRLSSLFEEFCTCFNDADHVLVADVYSAGEAPIDGYNRDTLVTGLQAHGHRNARALPAPEDLPAMVSAITSKGDYVICLGAGTITQWAAALPAQLMELGTKAA